MAEEKVIVTAADFEEDGWSSEMAEVFEGLELSKAQVATMSRYECFEAFLQWEGILGYTSTILDALDNVNEMKSEEGEVSSG